MPIQVRLKSTGQLGVIPDDKFDPNLFEQVSQQQTQTTTQPQNLSSKAGNLLMNILKGAAQPFVNTGKRIGGANYELKRQQQMAGGNITNFLGNLLNSESLKNLSQQSYQKAASTNPFLKTEEDINRAKDPLQIAKDSAALLSYGIPVGGATQVAGRTMAASPLVGGAAAGALSGFGSSGDTPEEMLGAIALGGITGSAGGVLLNKILGGGGKRLQTKGQDIRSRVRQPQVRPSPFMATEEAKISSVLDNVGLKGSASQQIKQLPEAMKSLTKQIEDILVKDKTTIGVANLADDITNSLDNNINYDVSIPMYTKAKDKFVNQIISKANKTDDALTVTPKDLFEIKKNLNKQLSRAFDKLEKGSPLTPQEEVGMTIWETLDDIITKAVPNVKDLTKTQSYLYKASPGLASSRKGAGINIFGNKVQTDLPQKMVDVTGRSTGYAGTMLDKVLTPGVQTGIKQTVVPAMSIIPGMINQTDQGTSTSPDIARLKMTDSQTPPKPQQIAGMQSITPNMLLMGRMMLSDTDYKKLEDLYDIQVQASGGKDNATVQKRKQSIAEAEQVYNQLLDIALTAPTGTRGFLGATLGQLPGIEGGQAEDLKRVTEGYAKKIAGAFAGEVGVATDTDVQRWLGLMPKIGDTYDERVRALERMKATIDSEKERLGF